MSRKIIILLFNILFVFNLSAQDEPKEEPKIKVEDWNAETLGNSESKVASVSEFRKNLRLGGEFGLMSRSFGPNNIGLSASIKPQITYVLSENFEGGLLTGYSYYGTFGDYSFHFFEVGPIMRIYPFEPFFLQVEGNATYGTISTPSRSGDKFFFNAYIGGGYKSNLSENSYIVTGIKFNLMKNELTNNQIEPYGFLSFHFGL
jgi:hypothetical protein